MIQILTTPTEITTLFADPGQFRSIALNRPHPAHVEPSWYGDSTGHFEGDTLVVDTTSIGVHPEAGSSGTPHTNALHVVERWRYLKDGETSLAPTPHNDTFDSKDIIQGGRILRLEFTVDDPGAYRKSWTTTLDYLPLKSRVREYVCAENVRDPDLAPALPAAAFPDFEADPKVRRVISVILSRPW